MLASTVNVDPVTLMSPVKFVQRNVGDGFPLAEQRMTVPLATVDPLITPDVITLRGQSTDTIYVTERGSRKRQYPPRYAARRASQLNRLLPVAMNARSLNSK